MFLKKYVWVINLFLIFVGTYFFAKIVSNLIGSKIRIEKKLSAPQVAMVGGPQGAVSFEDYKIIMERNIFDSRELAPDIPEPTGEPTQANLEGPAVKTTLNIKLISTFSVGAGTDKRSSATVTPEKGEADTYSVGDEKQFAPGVKITKILPDRVEFVNGPRLEFVSLEDFGGGLTTGSPISALEKPGAPATGDAALPGGAGVKEVDSGKFVVDRAEVDNALGNIDQLFTQVRAVPQFEGGKTTGLKLLSIRSGSLFAKLGLQRNDVLERINGQQFDMKKGMELFNQLKDSDRISIDLVRNGQKTTIEYEIQ